MKPVEADGTKRAFTAKTPANVKSNQAPPRNDAPGMLLKFPVSPALPVFPGPPKQLSSPPAIPAVVVQSVQFVARSLQSATHSSTFPTMSNTPQLDLHLAREPVSTGAGESVTHVVDLSSALPGSGVPAAARCHSSFRSSRFPDSAQACTAWNQLTHAVGDTPGIDTA